MSMPSSSEDVATSAGRSPRFSMSSTSSRCSRAIEPWWARATSASASSFSRLATRSAERRLLTNTIVESWLRTSSSRRRVDGRPDRLARLAVHRRRARPARACPRPAPPPPGRAAWPRPASTIVDLAVAAQEPRDLLQRPLRRRQPDPLHRVGRPGARSRSSDSARWAPRLVAATAWISSTITVSTVRSTSRAAEVSIRYSDSGVVIRMSGGLRRIAARSRCDVSPLRSATVGSRGNVIPASGARRLRSMSWLSAFSGETYSTRVPRSAGSRARPSSAAQERGQRLARAGRCQQQRVARPRRSRASPAAGRGWAVRTCARTSREPVG